MTEVAERELTDVERKVVLWLLEHGNADASNYLPHAQRITVVGRCPCGCASIDFALDGKRPAQTGMHIIADYYWADENNYLGDIFLYATSGQLAGLEVYSMDGICDATTLPELESLKPIALAS